MSILTMNHSARRILTYSSRNRLCQLQQAVADSPRFYHSYDHPSSPPYSVTSDQILAAALKHVPTFGFSESSLRRGATDVGYLSASTNLFPKGAFDLVAYYLVTRRLALQNLVNDPKSGYANLWAENKVGVGSRVRRLLLDRLKMNSEAEVVHKWSEALALMSFPSNVPQSLSELTKLSDEIWFLAGDLSVDTSWYTKRGSLAGLYAAAEMYQTQDTSTDFSDTEAFVDARLNDLKTAGDSFHAIEEWASFSARGVVNILRSKGMRI